MDSAAPRIAICGAGISGLTLAGILSRALVGADGAKITVYERAGADRDQGYGLDLNEFGQEALARAGVYHRYWEVSRQQSDKMCFMHPSKFEPLAVSYTPRWLVDLFPGLGGTKYAARPESNREKLRDVLLDALAEHGNAEVLFDTAVMGIRELPGPDGSAAELLDEHGGSFGEFDLVVDAMGLHSKLRQHRVDDPVGIHYGTYTSPPP